MNGLFVDDVLCKKMSHSLQRLHLSVLQNGSVRMNDESMGLDEFDVPGTSGRKRLD